MSSTPLAEETEERRLYELGFCLREIVGMVFKSQTAIHTILKADGRGLRHQGGNRKKVPHEDLRRCEYLYVDRLWTIREIADHEGMSVDAIRHRLEDILGITMRTSAESARAKRTRTTGPTP